MNGWVDDNDDVKEEDDENEDGDQTPPPRDESFDSEFEAEEADDDVGLRRLTMSLRLRRPLLNLSECKEKDRVKFAMATLRERALTWWNGRTKAMGIEAANNTPWNKVKKWMTEEFCPRSVIQRMEQELYNLRMKGMDI
nr:putative retrotransposon Gag domain-containing protein [Tanacetum cinerariifolium]